jgi:3-hydroxyisobutyrate dehydrogenase-like beta-hydroxyacid dehydrogenase
MRGANGIFAGAAPGTLIIDTTTISVSLARELAQEAMTNGLDFVDAPISGGPQSAIDASLTAMIGGEPAACDRAAPLLDLLCAKVHRVGVAGEGTALRLINQAVYVAYMAAFAEGLAIGDAMGLDLETMLSVLSVSAAGHPMIESKYDEIRGLSDKGFAIDQAMNYLSLAGEAYHHASTATPVLDATRRSLKRAEDLGLSARDLIVARNAYLAQSPFADQAG